MRKSVLAALALAVLIGFAVWYFSDSVEIQNPAQNENQNVSEDLIEAKDHPYSIAALRARGYPGGVIKIEQELGDQGSFHLYKVSYLSDGLKLYALMSIPDSVKPENGFPVIILNHGYIEPAVYSTTSSYRSYHDQYSTQGFIVLKPDYRGHDDSEGEPISAHISADYTIDVLNLVASVKTFKDADASKIGMWGHSMGGGITLRAMAVSKDIKAAALLAGVVASPQKFYQYWQDKMNQPGVPSWIKENGQRALDAFGTPESNPELWESISPYEYINDMNMPIEIHHGTADTDVPIEFSDELNQALNASGKAVQYHVYQGGDHNLAGAARTPVLQRTFELFKRM